MGSGKVSNNSTTETNNKEIMSVICEYKWIHQMAPRSIRTYYLLPIYLRNQTHIFTSYEFIRNRQDMSVLYKN